MNFEFICLALDQEEAENKVKKMVEQGWLVDHSVSVGSTIFVTLSKPQ